MPSTPTYDAIASYTVPSGDIEIVFSNIPNTYRDLVITMDGQISVNSADAINFRVNQDYTAGYHAYTRLGTTTSIWADGTYYSSTAIDALYMSSSGRSSFEAHIFDYAKTDRYKQVLILSGSDNTNGLITRVSGAYKSTNAVSSLMLRFGAGTLFTAGTRFHMYGVAGA